MISKYAVPISLLILLPAAAWLLGSYSGGLLTQFAALGLATAALAMCWGFAGILSLGHAVSFAVGAYAYAWCSLNIEGVGQVLGFVVGVVIGVLLSGLIGLIGLRGQVDQVSFSLFTLVILFVAAQLVVAMPQVTGGFNGISGLSAFGLGGLGIPAELGRAFLTLVAVLVVILIRAVTSGPFGGVLDLLRDSPIRAASLGFRVPAIRILVFSAAGGITAFAGGLYVAQVRFASPSLLTISMAVSFVVWALIGSRKSILGVFSATVVMGFITSELSDRLLNVWMLITGLIFIVFVLFAPEGIIELVRRRLPARLRRSPEVELTSIADREKRERRSFDVSGVSVRFGGFVAVREAGLVAQANGIHVLIGPNGAGKSTLLNAISGIIPGATGSWRLGETELAGAPPWRIARAGVGRKYQKPSLALELSVAQHLALGRWGTSRSEWSLVFAKWHAEIPAVAWQLMERTGLWELRDRPAAELSHGQRQILELCMVLAAAPHVLLLDEPAAGMTRVESHALGEVLMEVAETSGAPILMVEHDMELVRRIAQRVTVLAAGEVIASGPVAVIEEDPRVREIYIGDHGATSSYDVKGEMA